LKEKKKDPLIGLIQSLTANEKRYFSMLFGKSDSDKNYLKIFAALEKNPALTNEELKKLLKKDNINISYEKGYLQKNILKALRQFHEGDSIYLQSSQILSDIEHLFNKELYDMALDMIEDQMEWGKEHELYGFVNDLLKWKRKIWMRSGRYNDLIQNQEQTHAEELFCLDRSYMIAIYKHLQSAIMGIIINRGLAKGETMVEELEKITQHPYMTDMSKAKGYHATHLYYECWSLCYQYMFKPQEAYEHQKKLVAFIENHPHKIQENPQIYSSALIMYASKCSAVGKYEEALQVVDKLEGILKMKGAKLHKALITNIQTFALERRFSIYNTSKMYAKATALYESQKEYIKANQANITPTTQSMISLYSSIAYFHLGNYDEALSIVRTMIDNPLYEMRIDNLMYAQMLHLMIHYELKNYELLPYLIKSFARFCKTKDFKQDFVMLFIDHMQKLTKAEEKASKTFGVYAKKYMAVGQNPKEKHESISLSPIDLIGWAEKHAA
jgi:tetratricopeptide (TPR) repeat protein